MGVFISQNREQIRVSVGYNTDSVYVSSASSAGNSGGTTFPDNTLETSDDLYNGRWVLLTSGGNDGNIRVVADYDGDISQITLRSAATGQITSAMTYELWSQDMPPARVHDFINRAIRAIPRKAAPSVTTYAHHTGGGIRSFDLASTMIGVQKVSYRANVQSEVVLDCDAAFDESVTASVTATLDDEDYREGGGACRLQVAAGVGTGLLASDSISSTDLSGYTHVEFWIKSSVVAAASDLTLRLSSTANAGTATDDLNVPALTAGIWTYCRVALNNPWLDTAIISVGLRQAVDIGAAYIWVDDIKAVRDDSEGWTELGREQWWIDQDERELVLSELALAEAGYSLLKVVGVKKPTELSADATSCDVEPEYIIAKATALAMRAHGDRERTTRETAFVEADRWEAMAQQALGRVQTAQGIRWVQDN